jgi:hypothetical protein
MVRSEKAFGSQIPHLAQIYLIGFYEEREFALYVSSISHELRIPVRFVSCPDDVCFCMSGYISEQCH